MPKSVLSKYPEMEVHLKENVYREVEESVIVNTVEDLLHYPVGVDFKPHFVECVHPSVLVAKTVISCVCSSRTRVYHYFE